MITVLLNELLWFCRVTDGKVVWQGTGREAEEAEASARREAERWLAQGSARSITQTRVVPARLDDGDL